MSSIEARLREAERHLADRDPVMRTLIERYGPCGLAAKRREPFQVLCASIISQQISSRAADTIQARIVAAFGERGRISAERLATAQIGALRACGLSQSKAKWLQFLGAQTASGALDFARLKRLDDEAAIELLDALPGIGRWTAEMFLIFALHRLDLFAMDDVGLRRGVDQLYGKGRKLSDRRTLSITRQWAPYRSVASWYLWRHADPVTQTWA
ncbi:DNA-3-methyladenine glycosylase family protein [Sinimarinibacterium thermocellulolyticum]|uniref:DNA-3-methyladenine glycosylase II n=1 Tax=Sinimarinibacterium thermocellulolyticum TaxID=3170016 RepID=A0ABV2A949_9GAMM